MKKMKFLLVFLAFAGIVLTSCNTTKGPPTISFQDGEGLISLDATVGVGDQFTVGVNADANAESSSALVSLKIYRSVADTTYTIDLSGTEYNADLSFDAWPEVAVETFTFTVTDADEQTASISLDITTEIQTVAVSKTTNVTLGSWNDPIGSFYDAELGGVYTRSEAKDNPALIDFLFYLGNTNGSTFASPADSAANTIDDLWLNQWEEGTQNETLFEASTMTVSEFDFISTDFAFPDFTGTASSMTQLLADDIITFKTVANKLGLIKINSINAKGDVVNIDVVYQD